MNRSICNVLICIAMVCVWPVASAHQPFAAVSDCDTLPTETFVYEIKDGQVTVAYVKFDNEHKGIWHESNGHAGLQTKNYFQDNDSSGSYSSGDDLCDGPDGSAVHI